MVTFLQVAQLEFCTYFTSPTYVSHAPPISSSLFRSTEFYQNTQGNAHYGEQDSLSYWLIC